MLVEGGMGKGEGGEGGGRHILDKLLHIVLDMQLSRHLRYLMHRRSRVKLVSHLAGKHKAHIIKT